MQVVSECSLAWTGDEYEEALPVVTLDVEAFSREVRAMVPAMVPA